MTLLRAAKPTDAGAMGAILGEFVDDTPWMPRVHSRAEDIAHAGEMIARGWVRVAEADGAVQGFSACKGSELNALYVTACARGQGMGSALIEALKSERDTLLLWTFAANAQARAFYDAHGFHEVARTDGAQNDERLPDIQLRWRKEAI